jgi:hypothetical protein
VGPPIAVELFPLALSGINEVKYPAHQRLLRCVRPARGLIPSGPKLDNRSRRRTSRKPTAAVRTRIRPLLGYRAMPARVSDCARFHQHLAGTLHFRAQPPRGQLVPSTLLSSYMASITFSTSRSVGSHQQTCNPDVIPADKEALALRARRRQTSGSWAIEGPPRERPMVCGRCRSVFNAVSICGHIRNPVIRLLNGR